MKNNFYKCYHTLNFFFEDQVNNSFVDLRNIFPSFLYLIIISEVSPNLIIYYILSYRSRRRKWDSIWRVFYTQMQVYSIWSSSTSTSNYIRRVRSPSYLSEFETTDILVVRLLFLEHDYFKNIDGKDLNNRHPQCIVLNYI